MNGRLTAGGFTPKVAVDIQMTLETALQEVTYGGFQK
jgi:hypothetical protein